MLSTLLKFKRGFTLIELSIASVVLGVGTLAVFTLILHWHSSLRDLEVAFEQLQQDMIDRPQPTIERRFSFLACELEGD